jgi:hypothetical protein
MRVLIFSGVALLLVALVVLMDARQDARFGALVPEPADDTPCAFTTAPEVLFESGDPHRSGSELLHYYEEPYPSVLWSARRPPPGSYDRFLAKLMERRVETDPVTLLRGSPWANNSIVARFAREWIVPVNCLEMLLTGAQNARMDLLDAPTEFVSFILRSPDGARVRIYVYTRNEDGIGNVGRIEETIAPALAEGWTLQIVLHNHTFHVDQRVLNAVTAPSEADAQLAGNLARDPGLSEAWITNGLHTARIPASEFGRFEGVGPQDGGATVR